MSIKFFGQFLLERNVIDAKSLLESIRFQESRNMKFGEYAISKGFLEKVQVKRLHDEQKRNDMMIGQLSVKLEMLTEEQVEEVLTMQKNDHICIGEAIVVKGFVAPEVIDRELAAFREDQSVYVLGETGVPDGLKQPEFVRIMGDITLKMLRRIAELEAKMDDGVFMEVEPGESYVAVSVTFSGGLNYDYIILADEEMARAVAGAIIGEDAATEDDDLVFDGVREFGNIVCGNLLARMAQMGKNVEISIPHTVKYGEGYQFVANRSAVKYTIATTSGLFALLIVEL
ncbi:MAG: chemotaxis protein CheX [Thermodesulfovibrionales bacterium]|nr:chemotaxis protein CheX [Thermodesulfovibrionales bacterium]